MNRQIVAATQVLESAKEELQDLFAKLDQGVEYFKAHPDEAVEHISSTLPYSKEDAREWMKTVTFSNKTGVVDEGVIEKTVGILKKAGVLGEDGIEPKAMIGGP